MRPAWGGMSLRVKLSHGHFEDCQLLSASLESAQQFGFLLGKFGVGENTTGMELRYALYRSQYHLLRGGSLGCRGLLLSRRLMLCVSAISSLHRRRRRPADGSY
jgi:hypothetical protein